MCTNIVLQLVRGRIEHPLKILIHALGATMGGAMRHLSNFLPELGKADQTNEYSVVIRESIPLPSPSENIKIVSIKDKMAESWWVRVGHDVFLLPGKLKKESYSCLVSLTNNGPIWSPIPHVFFQRNALYYCPDYFEKLNGWGKVETYTRRKLAIASMMRADLIVTPSQAMVDMIRNICPETVDRPFKVLLHGFTKDSLQEPLDPKYKILLSCCKGVRLLYPTHPAPHKGFEVLFDMLALLKKAGLEFTLFSTIEAKDWPVVVRPYEERVKELNICENVIFMGRVPPGQMGALYEACDLMVYPSLCESFGFSMIEAMGYGLPIVAAATPVNKEVCGDAASYYPPLDAQEGAKAILSALDPGDSARLKEEGRKRVDSFDWGWARYAKEFVSMIAAV